MKWIPVAEKLPQPWTDVLIALDNLKVHVGVYMGDLAWEWGEDANDNTGHESVTHWAYFPRHPELS